MRQNTDHAALRDAQIKLNKEVCVCVCVSSAVQRSTDTNALQMDAQIKLNKEECVLDTRQRSTSVNAAARNAQIKPQNGGVCK